MEALDVLRFVLVTLLTAGLLAGALRWYRLQAQKAQAAAQRRRLAPPRDIHRWRR